VKHTQRALEVYDRIAFPCFEAMWAAVDCNEDVQRVERLERIAADYVRRCFLRDTKTINHWDRVKEVPLEHIRARAQKNMKVGGT